MRSTTCFTFLAALCFGLAGCNSEGQTSTGRKNLPLSDGILIASHRSGGIAGFNDTVQVSGNWQLIATGRQTNWIRRLSGEEQKQVRDLLQRFETLQTSHSDGPDIADGMYTSLVARGNGSGKAQEKDIKELGALLDDLVAAKAN